MADNDQRFQELKNKYGSVLRTIEQSGVRLQNLHVQDNKLFIRGEAPSDDVKNRVWDQIKLVDPSYSDLTADLTVSPNAAPATAQSSAGMAEQTYTVERGDTLSKIAQQVYGSANQYMRIFEANRDQLSDPDKIQVGQTLKIPTAVS